MDRQLRCPNCGGEHTVVNPGITMLVCDFCKTTVYWDADTVLKMGVQSILPEADTRLFMHASGKLVGRDFEVVGRLRYDYGRGTWDEWYLQLSDGGVAWLSEDERELTLERAARIESAVPPARDLRVGHPVTVEHVGYTVRELGTATCIGGEGQLPFTILPGERYAYADLATLDGGGFATLEYDEGTVPHAYAGQVLTHQELLIEGEAPPSTAGAHEGKHVKCPNCAAVLPSIQDREVKTVVCEYCGAQNDVTGAEARVTGVNPPDFDAGFAFEIGQAGNFLGQRYEVCGRMLYEDAEGFPTREYLLFSPGEGYLWLAEENRHFVLNRPTQQAPARDPFSMTTKQGVTAGATQFRLYESGTQRLVYVDGALPWKATTGDTVRFADLVAPPRMFCVESDGQEVEYFHGTYLRAEEVWLAFGLKDRPPRSMGVHAAQPFVRGPVAKILMALGGIFALLNLGFLGWSASSSGRVILEQTFPGSEYLAESMSSPLVVGPEKVMGLSIQAPLSDSWIALDAALVDAQDRVVEEMDGDISYYSGVEDGESWSEGNKEHTTFFMAPAPGSYKLILKGTAGSGASSPSRGEPLTVRIYQGAILSRYFLAAFIFTFLFPFYEMTRKGLFEKRRWAPVTEDDDDDD
jgi:hypothetical protein